MELVIGKTAGFCFGVQNAINKTKEQIESQKTIYCLGELVHNKQVTNGLEKLGVKFIENIEEAEKKVIIRSHGAEKRIYEIAKQNHIEIIDLTCPKVLYIHEMIEEYVKKDYYIILIGQKKHPEIIATKSFCGEEYSLVEEETELEDIIENLEKTKKEKVAILAQTTYSLEKFNKIVELIQSKITKTTVEVRNTICNASKQRQEETKKMAGEVQAMIIIGGKNSSNTNKLYEVALKYCQNTQKVEISQELDLKKLEGLEKIGIMAGASTPKESIEEVVEILNKL